MRNKKSFVEALVEAVIAVMGMGLAAIGVYILYTILKLAPSILFYPGLAVIVTLGLACLIWLGSNS